MRALGTNVIMKPVIEALLEPTRNGSGGFGLSEKIAFEERIPFEILFVGPGWVNGRGMLIPLTVKPGDIVLLDPSNEHIRKVWKEYAFVFEGAKCLCLTAYRPDMESGNIAAVVGHVEPSGR